MNAKTNISLIKGFELRENGHLFCKDYDFGHIDEVVGKYFSLDCEDDDLILCERGFHACDCIGKIGTFYEIDKEDHVFFNIFVEKAFFEDAEKFVFKSFRVKNRHNIQKFFLKNCATGKNTGNDNAGRYNAGNYNIGDYNTGDYNSANYNTGSCNFGSCNTGSRNTGYYNAGNCNIGNNNTGDRNTGDHNTGDRNTGDHNTGNYNTGYRNVGNCNTGDYNVGHYNIGNRNVGNYNAGHCNTGNCNTGNYNTGSRNLTNYSSGFFAFEEPLAFCFGKPTSYTHEEFSDVFKDIIKSEPNFDDLMKLPNATEEAVKKYMEKWESLKKTVRSCNK